MTAVVRGYQAVIITFTGLTTAALPVDFRASTNGRGGSTGRLWIKNKGANVARLYLDGSKYITLAAGAIFDEPIEVAKFNVAADTGTTDLEILGMCLPTGNPPT